MVNLRNIPRTDAEAHAAKLLSDIAEIGQVYLKSLYSQPTSGLAEALEVAINRAEFSKGEEGLEYFSREGLKSFAAMENTIEDITYWIGEKIMEKIDEYNHTCSEVHEQNHKREQILQDEGWTRTTDGWKRAHCEIKNKM